MSTQQYTPETGLAWVSALIHEMKKGMNGRAAALPDEVAQNALLKAYRMGLVGYGAEGIDQLMRLWNTDLTMGQRLVATGLTKPYFYEPFDRWLRWSGKQATLYLPLDTSSDRTIRLEVPVTVTEEIRDGLTLTVDGTDIPLAREYELWKDGGYHLVCTTTIPQAAMHPDFQYTALELAAPDEFVSTHPETMGARSSFALADIRIG
ncbi:MAG: hypothetical protein MEQ84_06990 [Mesorhizobium sp.]|nr:hypothetical protein [Mesorhizobium sp.]